MKGLSQTLLVALVFLGSVCQSFAPVTVGSLKVNIFPPGAVTAGAQWEVDGLPPLRFSGTSVSVFAGTSHTVSFTDVSGWITPASFDVTVTQGQTTITNGTYVAAAPVLAVRLTTTNTAVVSWPSSSTGWNLQQNTNLLATGWIASPKIVTDDGTNKFIIVGPPSGKMFYRLQK